MLENPTNTGAPAKASRIQRGSLALVLIGGVTLSLMSYIGLFGNLRTIAPGKCYRSEQLKPQAFKEAIEAHGIKSVLNLRGEHGNQEWYKSELALCSAEKIDHADLNIGLGELPKPETLQQLVAKLEAGPYPMLLHCRSGSDRSGLAAAFYLHVVEHKPLPEAEAEQVSWRFGHFPIGKAKSINAFFQLYHETAHGQPLKEWLVQTYPAEYAKRVGAQSHGLVND